MPQPEALLIGLIHRLSLRMSSFETAMARADRSDNRSASVRRSASRLSIVIEEMEINCGDIAHGAAKERSRWHRLGE